MSEIKSTLDLVMEKTKHLSMSDAEKEAQHKAEVKKTLKGLILKFKDRILQQEQFAKDLKRLEREYRFNVRTALVNEILEETDLETGNGPLIILLKEICGIDTAPLEAFLKEYAERITSARENRISEMKEYLHKTRRISGSAVVPNLENDTGWEREHQSIEETYRTKLEKIKAKMADR